jgi:saccharopine dehydrogenase-like NADP-dependent oxidoreductase
LESVLILGCNYGSYGREVAKSCEKKGFIVFATVGSLSEIDDLERSGNGYIKALVLDAGNVSQNHEAYWSGQLI